MHGSGEQEIHLSVALEYGGHVSKVASGRSFLVKSPQSGLTHFLPSVSALVYGSQKAQVPSLVNTWFYLHVSGRH